MEKKIIFVLNCGRSGSASFAKAFGLEHEPDKGKPNIYALKNRIKDKEVYGETNNAWKCFLDALKKEFPNAVYIHLIRNGRDTVSSLIKRGTYSFSLVDYPQRNLKLPIENFENMTVFEKNCWYWRYWNEAFEKYSTSTIRLEDISWFLPKLNKDSRKIDWTSESERIFQRICGKLMKKYNYNKEKK